VTQPREEVLTVPAPDPARRRALVVLGVATVVLIATVALSVVGLVQLSHGNHVDDERRQAAAAAGQLAVDFTSIDYRHLQQDIATTAAHATAAFATKYTATIKALGPVYRRGKVVVTTSVRATGLQSITSSSAVALVALKGVSSNTVTPNGSETLFRIQVNLAKQGHTWLASNVQPL
jgi:Mce-associated membrane protein